MPLKLIPDLVLTQIFDVIYNAYAEKIYLKNYTKFNHIILS